jgi:hypothetical protein
MEGKDEEIMKRGERVLIEEVPTVFVEKSDKVKLLNSTIEQRNYAIEQMYHKARELRDNMDVTIESLRICEICGKLDAKVVTLRNPKGVAHLTEILLCSGCKKEKDDVLETIYRCDTCGINFPSQNQYDMHEYKRHER